MAIDKGLVTGSTTMLILRLLDGQDMYGYQMIEELARRSDRTFELKSGTLYPLLHLMEEKGLITSYMQAEDAPRPRKYYKITDNGRAALSERVKEWRLFSRAVDAVMEGGTNENA